MEDNYNETVIWAEQEEKLRLNRGQGISSFYLIFGAFLIFLISFLILYYSNSEEKNEYVSIEMMTNPDNILEDEFSITGYEDSENNEPVNDEK